jgi:transposase
LIGTTRAVAVFAYAAPVDMRKSYEGLSALVRNELRRDIMAGELYLFTNRRRTRAKVLMFDGTGLCIYMKRLDRGCFARLWQQPSEGTALPMTMSELSLFLEGSEFVGRRSLSPPALTHKDLAVTIPM